MTEKRKLAAILVADIVGYSRLAGADEDRTLARLRALNSDLIDPTIAIYGGRVVKRTGDGGVVEFRSVVDAVRCAIEVQTGLIERNAGLPPERRIDFRIGIHIGDVVEESDGDLMGDGVNVAARLEGVASPGAICLSEDAYRQVRGRLHLAVTDLGLTELKNIVEPMRVYSLQVGLTGLPDAAAPAAKKSRAPRKRLLTWAFAAGAALLVLGAAGGVWLAHRARAPAPAAAPPSTAVAPEDAATSEPAHLSIVVLPFENLTGDAGQDFVADGIAENVTTELSRLPNTFVIAHETAHAYEAKRLDVREIGKDLNVRYVLEGSVQRDGNALRVNAQLIDARSGAHIWADRFDSDAADSFKSQDQVVARLVNSLRWVLTKAEAETGAKSRNPDAVDLAMRGMVTLQQSAASPSKENVEGARAFFERALKIDPDDADALAGEAQTYLLEYGSTWRAPDTDYDAKIIAQADRALALAPGVVMAYWAKGVYLIDLRRPEDALGVAAAGLAADPNSTRMRVLRGMAYNALGRFGEAKTELDRAIELNPHDPGIGFRLVTLARAEIGLGQYEAAAEASRKAIDGGYRGFVAYLSLAAALALQGKAEEAASALAEARRLEPGLTMKQMRSMAQSMPPQALDALHKAGVPEE